MVESDRYGANKAEYAVPHERNQGWSVGKHVCDASKPKREPEYQIPEIATLGSR